MKGPATGAFTSIFLIKKIFQNFENVSTHHVDMFQEKHI